MFPLEFDNYTQMVFLKYKAYTITDILIGKYSVPTGLILENGK